LPLSVRRDAAVTKRFFRQALAQVHTLSLRTITVDTILADLA
jgi:transposase-like protein